MNQLAAKKAPMEQRAPLCEQQAINEQILRRVVDGLTLIRELIGCRVAPFNNDEKVPPPNLETTTGQAINTHRELVRCIENINCILDELRLPTPEPMRTVNRLHARVMVYLKHHPNATDVQVAVDLDLDEVVVAYVRDRLSRAGYLKPEVVNDN